MEPWQVFGQEIRWTMNILALEPYYGGSHQALLDGWIAHSRHRWTLLTLPPHKWKWRMRHAAVTLAELAGRQQVADRQWDVLFASDMLNLAEFLGISMVEAMSAGARPLLPQRLAYPEILAPLGPDAAGFLYDGSAGQLAARLQAIAAGAAPGQWTAERASRVCGRFDWKRRAEEMDCRLEERA